MVKKLNEWLEKDHYSINHLMSYLSTKCNKELINDKHILIRKYSCDEENGYLSTLGLLNGLLDFIGSEYYISAEYEDEKIFRFSLNEKSDVNVNNEKH